ncbi:PRC-barrel domain-containing protein [Nodosilinea sp. LEGE 07088]|uniref:PRC-barrel domain-containing protein n=1 Tax=Nodosilinea sp. LEGE 07088 TaxID=2777968 RepID=UPI0018828A47|nr:PRC-barrel domain-containing protein [Nodosilinea sp. LEGE 07088]MBE9136004.1 PRC-barrel domain-containing protein [Nodosilinea sp. LEGE 07088]
MDIPIGAKVKCTDGYCGESSHVLINPITQDVTHIVIGDNYWETSRIVTFGQILETTPDTIQLRCSRTDIFAMNKFVKTHYIENPLYDPNFVGLDRPISSRELWLEDPEAYMLWPYVTPDVESPYIPVEEEQIPPGEMAVCRGAEVHTTDGVVGQVDEFMVDPTSGHITHLVLKKGQFWGRQDITVPVSAIHHMHEYMVELNLDKQAIAALPKIPVRRFHQVAH